MVDWNPPIWMASFRNLKLDRPICVQSQKISQGFHKTLFWGDTQEVWIFKDCIADLLIYRYGDLQAKENFLAISCVLLLMG